MTWGIFTKNKVVATSNLAYSKVAALPYANNGRFGFDGSSQANETSLFCREKSKLEQAPDGSKHGMVPLPRRRRRNETRQRSVRICCPRQARGGRAPSSDPGWLGWLVSVWNEAWRGCLRGRRRGSDECGWQPSRRLREAAASPREGDREDRAELAPGGIRGFSGTKWRWRKKREEGGGEKQKRE